MAYIGVLDTLVSRPDAWSVRAVTYPAQTFSPPSLHHPGVYPGIIFGTLTEAGVPAPARAVHCYHKPSGSRVASTVSDSAGRYKLPGLNLAWQYTVMAVDPSNGYNAVVQDNVTPSLDLEGDAVVTAQATGSLSAGRIEGTPPTALVGAAYSFAPTAPDVTAPILWSIISGSLPVWASLNTSTGEITGVAQAGAIATFVLQAAGADVTVSREFSISVSATQYQAGFETDTDGFVGGWIRTTEWQSVGAYSLRSGNAGQNSTTSTSTLSLTLGVPGTLSFDWSVSSEASWDKLTVTANGVAVVNAVSGAVGGSYSGAVPAGAFTLEVSFSKDGSSGVGLDGGFIDNIEISG